MPQTKTSLLAGSGKFEDVTSIMTLINQRRYNGRLHIIGVTSGNMFYENGQVVHVTAGSRDGEDALHDLMRGTLMEEVRFEFWRDETQGLHSVQKEHDSLLFGLAKVMDENDERERRILNEDPSALTLNADPNIIDTLAVFRDTADTPFMFEDEPPPAPAPQSAALMGADFWTALRDATIDVVGPAGPTVMNVVARQRKYTSIDRSVLIPQPEVHDFLQAVVDKVLPELRPSLAARFEQVKLQF